MRRLADELIAAHREPAHPRVGVVLLLVYLLLGLAILGLFTAAGAQAQPVVYVSTSGSVTTNGADCTTSTNCVIMTQAARTSNGTIVVTGTWTGTLTFEGTLLDMTVAANQTAATGWFSLNVLPNGSNSYVTTATANGQWIVPMALTGVRARGSAAMTGSASVAIAVTSARMNRVPGVDGTTVQFADGTAAAPSMTFLNDTALGCWRQAANTMGCGGSSASTKAIEFRFATGLLFGLNEQGGYWNVNTNGVLYGAIAGASGIRMPNGGFLMGVLTNTAAYTPITGAGCGAATECFFAIAADGKIPAGAINAANHALEIELAGVYGANATDTLALNLKLCTVSGCGSGTVVQVATTGTVTMSAATAQGWSARVRCNVFTSGASGTLDCQGVPGAQFFSALTTAIVDDIVNTGTSTVNTTVDEFLSVSATWSSTNAANTITLRNFGVKIL